MKRPLILLIYSNNDKNQMTPSEILFYGTTYSTEISILHFADFITGCVIFVPFMGCTDQKFSVKCLKGG